MTFVFKFIRSLFGLIDSIVYSAISQAFQLIFDLSNVEIFSETTINKFASRIYVILGLVMVFKLMISFIQIIVNPDKMDDKEKGVGNILGRVALSILLIVFVPSIFSMARQLQNYIIPVIPRVLLGKDILASGEPGIDADNLELVSERMAFYTFLPFFDYDNPSCDDGSILGTSGTDANVTIMNVTTAVNLSTVTNSCSTDAHQFRYKYRIGLSTLVGAYVLIVIVQLAVAIAIRAIKLAVCEFVAPIPIASYIDPKTSKQTFDKWVSTSLKTYADLFIRLILVYFMLFVFSVIINPETKTIEIITRKLGGDTFRTSLVVLFLIVGLLQFVKTAPKFLSDLLGIKEGGDLMGMFKGEDLKAFKEAAGIPGTALAAIGSGVGNARYAWKNGDRLKAIFRGAGGMVGATRRGLVSTLKGEGWEGAYTNNVKTTTGISQRKVNAHFMAKQSRMEYDDMINQIEKEYSEAIDKIDKDKSLSAAQKRKAKEQALANKNSRVSRIPRPIQPIRDKARNAVDRWMGMESPTGSSYSSAASTLSSWREKFYTGEAMKKLDEEGSKLNNIMHGYEDDSGRKVNLNYSQVRAAYDQLMNGTYNGKIGGHAFDASKIREMFSLAQKNGAIDYINAALDPNNKDVSNATLTEMSKQVKGMIEGLGIEAGLKKQLMDEYDTNPGAFFKNLSDITKQLETSGGRRSSYEQNQEKKN